MTNHLRISVFLFILYLPFIVSSGQGNTILTEIISEKFNNYCKAVPWEEIFVHTDRDRFIAGEDIWFKAYLISRPDNNPANASKLAYFELLNSENKPVVQKRIRLENGSGPGQITLPDTLSTGSYKIRVYTNWMKNFFPHNCFMKEIMIYNAISDKTLKGRSTIAANKPVESDNFTSSGHRGAGILLSADNNRDKLVLNISADDSYRSENNNLCYIFIQTHGKINSVSSSELSAGINRITFDKRILSPGVNQITLLDSKGNYLTEINIYTPEPGTSTLTLMVSDSAGLREKLYLELGSGNGLLPVGDNPDLSVSVVPHIGDKGNYDLPSYMIFGTEFGILPDENFMSGGIAPENPDKFLSGVRSKWIDWSRIISGNIPQFEYQRETEGHYLSGRLVGKNTLESDSGKCLFLSTPGKNAGFRYARTGKDGSFTFSLPIAEEINDLIIQPEIADGNSVIRIGSSYAEDNISFTKIDDTSAIVVPDYISRLSINHQVRKIYESASSGDPVYPEHKLPVTKRFYGKPDIEIRLADYIDLPDMQEVFFELIPGVSLRNRRSVYSMHVEDPVNDRILDKPPIMFIDGVVVNDPSVIAGLDPEKIEKIDAVKGLYLTGDYMFFGIVHVISTAGDFSMVTLPDYAVRLKYRVVEPVRSFYTEDHSASGLKKSRIPDFRNTLHWNPSLKPGNDGKIRTEFWSSDVTGDYEVNIQGFTSDGKLLSVKKIIKIK
jgi:hypothetical protein